MNCDRSDVLLIDDFGDNKLISVHCGELDDGGVDFTSLSPFEKDVVLAALEIALNDIAESRMLRHGRLDRAVEYDDLSEDEQCLVDKHLYGKDVDCGIEYADDDDTVQS